jgi:plasmid stability protein
MGQVLIRSLDDDVIAAYRAAAVANDRSLEAELREALKRAKPIGAGDRRALAMQVRDLLPKDVPGEDGADIIRRYRDTIGDSEPDRS